MEGGGTVIDPGIETAQASEAKIVAAYMAGGMQWGDAETYAAVLANPDPRFPVD